MGEEEAIRINELMKEVEKAYKEIEKLKSKVKQMTCCCCGICCYNNKIVEKREDEN